MARVRDGQAGVRAAILERALRGLSVWFGLSAADAARLCGEECPLSWVPEDAAVGWNDGFPGPKLVVGGWLCEMRSLPDGRRQIFAFFLPGDICFPLHPSASGRVTVQALTAARLLSIGPVLRGTRGAALREMLREAAVLNMERRYDTALRLGQLTAEERAVDLLEDFRERLEAIDLVKEGAFRLPLTQAELADALGMSPAYLNKTLSSLRRRGLVDLKAGRVRLPDRQSRDPAPIRYRRYPQGSSQPKSPR